MATLIQLTSVNGGVTHVNADAIAYFKASTSGTSIVFGGDGNDKLRLVVEEPPDAVASAIRGASPRP